MAENKDKDTKPSATPESRAADKARADEAKERQGRIDRATREVQSADAPPTRPTLVGGITVEAPNEDVEGFVAEAAGAMLDQTNRAMSGKPVGAMLTPEQEEKQRKAADERAKAPRPVQGDILTNLGRAIAEHQVAPALTVDMLTPPEPGMTERGWDPEVTARHPKFLAAMIAELEGVDGEASKPLGAKAGDKSHFIDPTDANALAAAQSSLSFHESRKTGIIQRAIRIGSDRLAAAQAAAGADFAQASAANEVLEDIRKAARAEGHDL
jgi:hypothetical protein